MQKYELMWCNGKCSERLQKQTMHTCYQSGAMIVYRCQVCGAEQEYRKPVEVRK